MIIEYIKYSKSLIKIRYAFQKIIDAYNHSIKRKYALASKNRKKIKDAVRRDLETKPQLITPYLEEHN